MAESTTCTTQDTNNVTTVVTQTVDDTTTTTTTTNNQSCTKTVTDSDEDEIDNSNGCACGPFNLDKLAEQSRNAAFRSSNIAVATSNSVSIFAMLILQELLIKQCRKKQLNLDDLFLITTAIAALAENVQSYNPQPLNP